MGWRKPGSRGDAGRLFEQRGVSGGREAVGGTGVVAGSVAIGVVAIGVAVRGTGGSVSQPIKGIDGAVRHCVSCNCVSCSNCVSVSNRAPVCDSSAAVRHTAAGKWSRVRRCVRRDVVAQSEFAACC
jgi:hypothetical protein